MGGNSKGVEIKELINAMQTCPGFSQSYEVILESEQALAIESLGMAFNFSLST